MAALAKSEESWKESVKASVLHGPEKFVTAMLAELKGDRRAWELLSAQRANGVAGLAYYPGQRHAGITLRKLGRYLGKVEYPAVSVAITGFEKRLKTNRSLQKRLKQVIKLLNVEI